MEAVATPQIASPIPGQTNDPLQAQVEGRRREIRTDGYSMSIGELASLYSEGEMIINPKFQRFFRWTDEQKTALVESILLGIPLPSIFVSTNENGVWNVVDGLQRMSTIFQAMGKLKDMPPLTFTKARYLTELEGREWGGLPKLLQLDFRRAKINVSIILRGGDSRAQYDLFERLNTGGAVLSEQEVRNCLLVMENEKFYDWLVELSEIPDFQECLAISGRRESEGYHKELASRFLIFSDIKDEDLKGIGGMGHFVNQKMLAMAGEDSTRLDARKKVFIDTFKILNAPRIGDNAFKRYYAESQKFKGGLTMAPFEAVACGIAYHLGRGANINDFPPDSVLEKIKGMWESDGLSNATGAGRKGAIRLPVTIPYGRDLFRPGA